MKYTNLSSYWTKTKSLTVQGAQKLKTSAAEFDTEQTVGTRNTQLFILVLAVLIPGLFILNAAITLERDLNTAYLHLEDANAGTSEIMEELAELRKVVEDNEISIDKKETEIASLKEQKNSLESTIDEIEAEQAAAEAEAEENKKKQDDDSDNWWNNWNRSRN